MNVLICFYFIKNKLLIYFKTLFVTMNYAWRGLSCVVLIWITIDVLIAERTGIARNVDYENNRETLDSIPSLYEIVYPVFMRMNNALPNLDTRDQTSNKTLGTHYHHITMKLPVNGKQYKIKLELNRGLLSDAFKQKHNKRQIIEGMAPENCYYSGKIKKFSESQVVISTCRGVRGVIVLKPNEIYFIRPLKVRQDNTQIVFPHVIFKALLTNSPTCGNDRGMWNSYRDMSSHQAEFLRNIKILKPRYDDTFQDAKYLRLAFVADHTLMNLMNGTISDNLEYFILVANILDTMFKGLKINIQVKLVYVELWNQQDLFTVDANARSTLTSFLQYRLDNMADSSFDYAHFFTGRRFDDNELGMAIPDSICSERSLAVSQVGNVDDLLQVAAGTSHLLAHAFGVLHDMNEGCLCDSPSGCIMEMINSNRFSTHSHHWSSCSNKNFREAILSQLSDCLQRKPNTEPTFVQTCGNGIIERGEECDCANKEECTMTDPCCDSKTCLLKPWATCRDGDCCHNCTVRPSNQMCRDRFGVCDVPEFCDGVSGNCPVNSLIQDGQICRSENADGYCYRGSCQTYAEQCRSIWGQGAVGGDDGCYKMFNPGGTFNGHCGRNQTSADYLKCSVDNVKCGLLHCSNGSDVPLIGHNSTFSVTTIASHGQNYHCKIIHSRLETPPVSIQVGMVQDGSMCGIDSICIGSECVPVSKVMPVKCPTGLNGLICSGQGECTTDVKCFCNYNFTGPDCSQPSNRTFLPLLTTIGIPTPTHSTVLMTSTVNVTLNSSFVSTTLPLGVQTKDVGSVHGSTLWPLVALGCVVAGACIVLVFCLLCYRRKSPASKNAKKKSSKGKFGSVGSFTSMSNGKYLESNYGPPANRIISFGSTPSYRAHKIKKAMRGGLSETESEHSKRDSAEVKAASTLPLAKPPEKGILKYPQGSGKRRSKLVDQEMKKLRPSSGLEADLENAGLYEDGGMEEKKEVGGVRCSGLDFIDDDDEDESSCSCSTDEETSEGRKSSKDSSSTANDQLSKNVKRGSDEETKPKQNQYKELNELWKQIDEQFNSVLRQTSAPSPTTPPNLATPSKLSPSNSEDLRCSETEADRHLPRTGFYRQDDTEVDPKPLLPPRTSSGVHLPLSSPSSLAPRSSPALLPPRSSPALLSPRSSPALLSPRSTSGLLASQSSAAPCAVSNSKLKERNFSPVGGLPDILSVKPSSNTVEPRSPGPVVPRVPSHGPSPIGAPLSHSTPPLRTSQNKTLPEDSRTESKCSSTNIPSNQLVDTVPYRGTKSSSPTMNAANQIGDKNRVETDSNLSRHGPSPTSSRDYSRKATPLSNRDVLRKSNTPPMTGGTLPMKGGTPPMKGGTPPSKGHSSGSNENGEGSCSDRGNAMEDSVIIREIPSMKELELNFAPDPRGAYTKAPGSPSSPEDVDV